MNVVSTQRRNAGTILALLFIIASQGACARLLPKELPDPAIEAQRVYAQQIDQWHQERLANLARTCL